MPLVQTQPQGHTVRLLAIPFHCGEAHTKNKTREIVQGHHFGPLWARRRVVDFDVDVPPNESPTNFRYVDLKSHYTRTTTSLNIHESRVHIGRDMFLVSGYWDPKADVNRSVLAIAKIIWRGELSIVHAGRYVPYYKRMKDSHKADLAVKRCVNSFTIRVISSLTSPTRFVQIFKYRKALRKFVPKTIIVQ